MISVQMAWAAIASLYPNIPPVLADSLVARIVYERRHRQLDEGAPLPRPDDKDDWHSEFHLYAQVEFQEGWNDKLKEIDALFQGTATKEAAQARLKNKRLERKLKEVHERGQKLILGTK